ncbi:tRNA glutamyl-Q(34) synthetase GluQRS [Actinomyces minihominis]|uniref:tRNA glutamyl-Q(34) synthetase GluQRS n=1 Tax=Actinomyces minihominis TaxID=2002838 RepID=UPI000C072C19|nr:tRNA glutamyl-Q(34) synthetase GluQRS [Actinomyces minihominis]
MPAGRYAPSPTGDLHLGNLRTALVAWASARSSGRDFYLRLEDLDRDRFRDPQSQINDLEEIGIDWDGEVVVQSERLDLYQTAIETLAAQGMVFECFCSRRDIREAASAAHTPPGHYPGTCLGMTEGEMAEKRASLASRRLKPALRFRPKVDNFTVVDQYVGEYTGAVDPVVLQRGDGAFAYNLAVVVDDVAMGVDQVVRGDDLLTSAPVQTYLTEALGGTPPIYGHVPLVLGPGGARLAKRDGAVTLSELRDLGHTTEEILRLLSKSLGLPEVSSASSFLEVFNDYTPQTTPWVYAPEPT